MKIKNWEILKTGDDACDANFFEVDKFPKLAFECHQKIFELYKNSV